MAFIVDTFSILDEEHLGRLMLYAEGVGHFIGDWPVADQVQEIEVDGDRLSGSFQPVFYQGAGGATGAMFKNELGAVRRLFLDLL